MIDPKQLLEQVLGGNMGGAGRNLKAQLDAAGGSRGFAGGAIAGGLLGMLLGGGRRRGFGGSIGSAVLGALALQAYQTYQRRQAESGQGRAEVMSSSFDEQALPHSRPAADGSPFELTLVRAMVGAAKSDGHIDAAEQQRLFAEVERLNLDADAKAYVFDLLTHDVDPNGLAAAVDTPEQGAELYLAARLAIDPDQPAERAYLDALAARLRLPPELRATLDEGAGVTVSVQPKPPSAN